MIRFFLVFGLLAVLIWTGQHIVISGEAVLANHRAAVEAVADQLK